MRLKKIDSIIVRHWLNSLVIERLKVRQNQYLRYFRKPETTGRRHFTGCCTRYFGFRVNTEPFEMLATALPFRIIRKHTDNLFQIEALAFRYCRYARRRTF